MSTYTFVQLIATLFNFYSTLIVVYCIMSWFPMRPGGLADDIRSVLDTICGPWLNLFRRFIPPMGGVDFSPIVAILALTAVERILVSILI